MSLGDRHHLSVLWITLQFFFAIINRDRQAMALLTPYVSEFQYAPESHPSRNPSCPRRWARGAWEERRSPDEGPPVGQEPSIEIRAVLVRCPKSPEEMVEIPVTGTAYNISAGRSKDILEFHGFDRDEPAHHSEVKDCRRKLVVTMKFNNVGKTRTQEEFVVVDHVLDPVTMRKARLLNPFVFKVRQEQVLQLYGLKFQSVVNGEAKEEVINKKLSNYTGCDDSLDNPTCGQMMFDGKPIPYSQGFCCSCDPDVNAARQPTARSNTSQLGTSQKLIPNPEENQIPGYDDARLNGMFARLFASPKPPSEKFWNEERVEDSVNRGSRESLTKRERSLKSSGARTEFNKDKENLGIPLAMNSPSKGKIEPYIEAVREEALREENFRRNVDAQINRKSVSSDKEPDGLSSPKRKHTDLNAQLVELEKEYEALKTSRKRVEGRAAEPDFRNHSKCRDFRKLARERAKHFDFSNTSSVERASDERKPVFSSIERELLDRNKIKNGGGAERREISWKTGENVTSVGTTMSVSSTSSKESCGAITPSNSMSNSSFSSRLSLTTISSSNRGQISTPESTPYPALILRQELVNDELYSPLIPNVERPQEDITSQTAEKALKKVDSESLRLMARSEAKTRDNHWRRTEEESSKGEIDRTEKRNIVHGLMREAKEADKSMEKPIKNELTSKLDRGLNGRRHFGEMGDENAEPAVIMRGIGDMVKGDYRYEDESATVIADHRYEEPASSTEREYIFLDANGRQKGRKERFESRANQSLEHFADLREYLKSEASNNPRLRSMGRKIEKALFREERLAEDESMREKFNRLNSLVRNGPRSRRRSFRSVAYDDPFERRSGEDKQTEIDDQIEKEFVEITKALKESSESDKRGGELSSLRESTDSENDPMLRDLAMILNRIPKVDMLKTGSAIVPREETIREDAPLTDIEKFYHPEPEPNDGHQIGGKRFRSNSRELVSPGSSQQGSRRTSGEITGQEMGDMAMRGPDWDARRSSSGQTGAGNYKTIKPLTVRSSTNNHRRAGDFIGLQESQTNINDIVKQIINSDYKTSPSWIGKQESLKAKNKFARNKIFDKRNKKSNSKIVDTSKSFTYGTMMRVRDNNNKLNRERLARLSSYADKKEIVKGRKRDEKTTVAAGRLAFRESETAEPELSTVSTIVPEKNSPGILAPVSMDVGSETSSVKGAISAVTTPRIASVKNDQANTGLELLETEVMTISEAIMTTTLPRTVKSSSSSPSSAVNAGEKFSSLVNEKPDVSIEKNSSSTRDRVSEKREEDARGKKVLASCPKQFEDKRNDEAISGAEKLQLNNKALKKARRAYNGRDRITGKTIVRKNDTGWYSDKLMRTISGESTISSRENDGRRNEGATTASEGTTTNNGEQTVTGYKETITVYKTTGKSGSSIVEHVRDSHESPTTTLTLWRELTSGEENSDTEKPETDEVVVKSESQKFEISDLGKTPTAITDGYPNSQRVKSSEEAVRDQETPQGSFHRVKTVKPSSVVLIKTYSVSQEPRREYLDNFEFPVGVKRISMKKFNSTITRTLDPINVLTRGESLPHIRNINDELLINGKEREDDPQTYYSDVRARDMASGRARKVNIEDNVSADINKRVAIPYTGNNQAAVDPNRMINELIERKENAATTRTSVDKLIRNYGPEDTRSFKSTKTFSPDEETTHIALDGDVNATNYEREYFAMDQPIFTEKNTKKVNWNDKKKPRQGVVELFYDYDQESNSGEVNNTPVKRLFGASDCESSEIDGERIRSYVDHSRDRRSSDEDVKSKNFVKRYRDKGAKTQYGSVKKRKARERDERGGGPKALYSEQSVGESNISGSVKAENDEIETGVEPRFDDVPDVKWQGKMDRLKLKKHQEILKEYLNWNSSIDATEMKIFSPFSTGKFLPTPKITLRKGKEENGWNSLNANVLPRKNEAKGKLGVQQTTVRKKSSRMHARNVNGSTSSSAEILDKQMKLPGNGDGTILISMSEKKKKNKLKEVHERLERGIAEGINDRGPVGSVNFESGEREHEGFGRRRRNIGQFSRRKAKSDDSWNQRISGRRLMSTNQLGVNADNETRKEEEEEEEGKDAIRKDDQTLPEDEELPLKSDASSFDYLDSSYKKLKRDKLKSNWDQLVDKVIVNNNNSSSNNNNNNKDGGNDPPAKKRRSNDKQVEEIRSGNGRTAMEKLHFFDADKYIRIMANKISRLSTVDNTMEDPRASNPGQIIHDSGPRMSKKFVDDKSSEEDLKIDSIGEDKGERENDDEDDSEKLGDYHEPEKRALDDEKMIKTVADYGGEIIPYERDSRLVMESSSEGRDSIFGKLGSDFEISISGKVHINGGMEGQPMSLSIEGLSVDNVTSSGVGSSSSGSVNQDVATGNGKNKNDSVSGTAAAAAAASSPVPQNSTDIQPKRDFIVADKTGGESVDLPEVIRAMHAEKTSPETYRSEGSKQLVSPRKTFYNVQVRAHPGYEKWPVVEGARNLGIDGEKSERKDVDMEFEKSSENLTDDEPIFDFAKLELRRPKASTSVKMRHLPRGNYQRFREERATSRSAGQSGDADKLKRFEESIFEEIPKESSTSLEVSRGETERESSTALKEAFNKLRKQSKASDSSNGRENGLEEFEDGQRKVDADANAFVGKKIAEGLTRKDDKDEVDEVIPKKNNLHKASSEPCYESEPEIRVMEIPQTNFGIVEKARLSTDDLHRQSSSKSADKTGEGKETLLKGVEVSSAGESDPHLREHESHDVESRKEIELKNLMRMIKFVKKMENLVPRYEEESKAIEERPEAAVVKIESVLLVPENVSGSEVEGISNKELERLKPGPERVVEIGEGVRHAGTHRSNNGEREKDRIPDFIIVENPTGVESRFDKDFDGVFEKKGENMISNNREENPEVEENFKGVDSAGKDDFKNGKFFGNVEKKISDMEDNRSVEPSDGESCSSFELLAHPYSGKINGESGFSKEKNDRSLKILRSVGNSEEFALRGGLRRVGSEDAGKVEGYSSGVSNVKKPDEDGDEEDEVEGLWEGNESGETVVGSKVNDVDRLDLYDVGIAEDDPEGREGLSVGNTPRRNSQLGRKARTAVAGVAFGVREDPTLAKSSRNIGKVSKEKRRTQHLTNRKTTSSVTRGREKSKRSHGKRHKNKNKKKKNKKKKNKKKKNRKHGEEDDELKIETETRNEGSGKKKWWPFKRNLLAVIEDHEEPIKESMEKSTASFSSTSSSSYYRRKKRQIKAGGIQSRGGQDCMDRRHPAGVNSAKYQESAHCLRFSDLWYSVYQLEKPIMEHTVYLQLFEKHTLADGSTHWDDLTQGSMIRLGTFVRHQRDGAPTIAFTYNGAKVVPEKNQGHSLDSAKDRLLVPSPVAAEKLGKYPEAKGGSSEYLIVQSSSINRDGNECDKAGVGFSTFATQPNRCGQPAGTCLKNQPLAYWRHDVEAREAGRPGCYFLSNFASVPNNPIKYNVSGSGSREYLGLEYHSPHVSAIDVEVRADYNAIVRVGSSGRVTEVHVDSTAPEHTVVTIVISNMGLASSPYQSRISDCPTGLPVSWRRAKGAMQVIPPQHDLRVTLDLYGQLFVNGFHCSVEVVNHHGELVAMRRIRVQRMDRCFCVWHCLCACIGSVAGLRCQAMSPEHYHAAGFQGPVPVASMESSAVANAIKDVMTFSALVILVLLALGMLKWLIGVFLPRVSRRGLDVLLDGTRFDGYFEPELRCRCIVTDIEGNIVHPDTGEKSVRICSRKAEFFLNLIFFLTYPIAVCCKCARNLFLARRGSCCSHQDESKICLLREDTRPATELGPRPHNQLIRVNTYGDSRNSKMEAEDTRYVINELKRSRDSLQYGIKGGMNKEFDTFTGIDDHLLPQRMAETERGFQD